MRTKPYLLTTFTLLFLGPQVLPAAQKAGGEAKDAKSSFDTQYVAKDFVVAFVAHPQKILNSKPAEQTFAELEKHIPKPEIEKAWAEVEKQLGVNPRQVKQVVVLLDRDPLLSMPGFMPPQDPGQEPGGGAAGGGRAPQQPLIPSFIVRFEGKVDKQAVVKAALAGLREFHGPQARLPGGISPARPAETETVERKYAGKNYQVRGIVAACFVDDQTLLVSHESMLKQMIDAKDVDTPLTGRLKALGARHDGLFVVNVQAFANLFAFVPVQEMPAVFAKAFEAVKKTKTVAIAADVTGDVLWKGIAQTEDKKSAATLAKFFEDVVLNQFKTAWEQERKTAIKSTSKAAQYAVKVADELLAGVTIAANGTEATVTVKRPKQFDNLPGMIKPAVDEARAAARRSQRMNNLKQIAIAMHNYHDIHGAMPGHGANADGSKKGLSWRVHILPSLEQSQLYEQFKLDEPWDSDHNKKLIPKMPKIFQTEGVKDEGKTSIHVFVGKGTPFGIADRGPRLRDIVDGTSNTIMTVEAGPDKADVWTKPGGLPFDPEKDPLKALGKLPEDGFLVGMFDGSVRFISKTINQKILKLLIQHADGQPLGEF